MPLFWPGIGEKNGYSVQAFRGDMIRDKGEGVAVVNPDIVEAILFYKRQELSDTGRVHFHAKEIGVGPSFSDGRGSLSHAEPDFENEGFAVAEEAFRRNYVRLAHRNSVALVQLAVGLSLRVGHSAGAEHVRSNGLVIVYLLIVSFHEKNPIWFLMSYA